MRNKILVFFAVTLLFSTASAQQDPQFTMYMFNRAVLNPAYAGSMQATNITGVGRAQWVGVPGAPNTATISVNGYSEKLHGGLGAYIIGDKLGPLSTVGVKAAYSFHIDFGSDWYLNIGAQGGIYQKTLDGTNWDYRDQGTPDPVLQEVITNTIVPDVDAGLFLHKRMPNSIGSSYPLDRFYIGGAVSHILEPSINNLLQSGGNPQSVLARGISAMAGYTFDLDQTIFLQPSVNFRMAGPVYQLDINANLYVSPMVFGISHRWRDSFSGIIGFNASTDLFVGYSYDYTISGLGGFTTGSHELMVSYTFPSKYRNLPPRKGVSRYGE